MNEILRLKSEFINQCKNGVWKKSKWDEWYENEYFKFSRKDWKIQIKCIENDEIIGISEIGLSKLRMIILFFFIKESVANRQKKERKIKVQNITAEFFEKNKSLRRDSRIEEIIK
jgi:hypothetical protein